MVFICIFTFTSEVEHLFMSLWPLGIFIFFHVNCLILAFAHFSLFSVFPFLLSILEFYLFVRVL